MARSRRDTSSFSARISASVVRESRRSHPALSRVLCARCRVVFSRGQKGVCLLFRAVRRISLTRQGARGRCGAIAASGRGDQTSRSKISWMRTRPVRNNRGRLAGRLLATSTHWLHVWNKNEGGGAGGSVTLEKPAYVARRRSSRSEIGALSQMCARATNCACHALLEGRHACSETVVSGTGYSTGPLLNKQPGPLTSGSFSRKAVP